MAAPAVAHATLPGHDGFRVWDYEYWVYHSTVKNPHSGDFSTPLGLFWLALKVESCYANRVYKSKFCFEPWSGSRFAIARLFYGVKNLQATS